MQKAILLLNFGGPENLDEVRPFLQALFSDTDGIRTGLPSFLQKLLAWVIAKKRAPGVRLKYQEIGGSSPLVPMTKSIAQELAKILNLPVYYAMRLTNPRTPKVLQQMLAEGVEECLVLPLYPQYSYATTRSAILDLFRANTKNKIRLRTICHFHDYDPYIQIMVDLIRSSAPDPDHVFVFSAHGLPEQYLADGDVYADQTRITCQKIMQALNVSNPYVLAWQSKVGPQKWLRPSLDETLQDLAAKKHKKVFVIPVSFVSDHIETLHEIDIEAQETAHKSGLELSRCPLPNTSKAWIECLASLIQQNLSTETCGLNPCLCRKKL